MKEASFYEKSEDNKVRCFLCPHHCTIPDGHRGACKVRVNIGGVLYSEAYNKVAAIHSDPVEKKPLYHFYPGKQILSIGAVGCNFRCSFCQNASLSQASTDDFYHFSQADPPDIVAKALGTEDNIGLAFTYNEPFTFYEFMYDCAELSHLSGFKNVVVSNGYVNPKPLEKILPYIDAFNIDLKAFNNDFYKCLAGGSLEPVLDVLKIISSAKKHLEITFLAIPGANDNPEEFREMARWVAENVGEYTPLHISRYFPSYKMTNPLTPVSTLENFYDIASDFLKYVFLGNIPDETRSVTHCPACGKILIRRNIYSVNKIALGKNSTCNFCLAETGIIN